MNTTDKNSGFLYAIHCLKTDKWLANVRAPHPGAAIRDYLTWPKAAPAAYAIQMEFAA